MFGKPTLLGRIADVSDMVGSILFPAAPGWSYLFGQTLSIKGGWIRV